MFILKKTLLSAALMIAFSVTMLAGSTYAWFSDSQMSVNNQIKFGTFDMYLEIGDPYDTGVLVDETEVEFVEFEVGKNLIDMNVDDARNNVQPGSVITKLVKVNNQGNIDFAANFDLQNFDYKVGNLVATVNGQVLAENQYIIVEANEEIVIQFVYTVNTNLTDEDYAGKTPQIFDIQFNAIQTAAVNPENILIVE